MILSENDIAAAREIKQLELLHVQMNEPRLKALWERAEHLADKVLAQTEDPVLDKLEEVYNDHLLHEDDCNFLLGVAVPCDCVRCETAEVLHAAGRGV